jgi:LPXTG-motif cell wall-anchored protein
MNPLDVADYLATANITLQTAFGMTYVENFLGLGTVIFNSSVPKGKVYATITNTQGTTLPSTGGMGTTLFYVGGGALALGAGVLLVSKKRMANK